MAALKLTKSLFSIAGILLSAATFFWPQSAFGEVQYNITMSMTPPEPGANASFSASDSSSSGTGTFYNSYSGIGRYVLGGTVSGRYATYGGTTRYGVDFDNLHIFQSFLTANSLTTVSANTTCPGSATTYGFVTVRMRAPDALRNPQNASSTSFIGGGTFTYDSAANPDINGLTYFNLAGPTLTTSSGAFTANGLSAATCSSGKYIITSTGTLPWDQYNTIFFTATGGALLVGMGGNPAISIASPIEDLTVGRMSTLAGRVMSGIYTEYTGAQNRASVYAYPDGSGTTFTLRQVNDYDDPAQYTTYGTITCTSRNSPTQGFCSGTLTKNGESGSGKIVCQVSNRNYTDMLFCAGQKPSDNTVPVSLMVRNHGKALVAVTLPQPSFTLASATTGDVSAVVRNMTGNPVGGLSIPTLVGDRLTAPFSLPTPFTGAGGTCGATLGGYQQCNLTVHFAPSAVGTYSQVLRVEYDNEVATVNATANVIGTVSLDSITISPTGPFTNGGTQQFTATAHYSDLSTQDITNAVVWTTTDGTKATISSTGLASFVATGTVDITATSGVVAGSQTITINSANAAPAADFTIAQPDGTGDTVAKGEPFNLLFSGGADTDSNADVYFYYRTTNAGCNSGSIGSWTAINGSSPVKEDTQTGMSWDTSAITANSYYICGRITDGTNERYAVSSGTMTILGTATSKMITLHPSSSSEKSYNFMIDTYEANLSAAGTLDNVNAFASNTTTQVAESETGAFAAAGTMSWSGSYKACTNRGSGWRLPTNQEFDYASAGNGNNSTLCNTTTTVASTAMPYNSGSCVSNYGVYDLVGNLLEWVDLQSTVTVATLGSSVVKAATDEGAAFVGKLAASYNGQVVSATGVQVAKWDPELGLPTTTGSLTTGFTASDIWTFGTGANYAMLRGGYYSMANASGGRYYARLDRANANVTNAAFGFRCARSLNNIPAVRVTAPAGSTPLAAVGSNVTITFQGNDNDDNADIALYYRASSANGAGCSGDPASNGWTLIDNTLKENTNTSKVFDISGLTDNTLYHVCATITDNHNAMQYHTSTGVFIKGSVTDAPAITLEEPTGNNDSITENGNFNITFTATDWDSAATITLFWKTADSTGCSGTPTSQGWTAMTTTPSTITEGTDTFANWDVTAINTVTYPANFYVCARITDGATTSYANSGSNYLRVLPVFKCSTDSGNYTTSNGGCYNSVRALTYSQDSFYYTSSNRNFAGATTYCALLNTNVQGGYSNWRVPTPTELANLRTDGYATNLTLSTSYNMWTNQNPGGPNATSYNISTGSQTNIAETSSINALCVRP